MISLVTITKNEEDNLKKLLASVSDSIGEIIVVDHYSNDNTIQVANSFDAKVYSKTWEGFGSAKNYGLNKATGDWILILDADEVPSKELLNKISDIDENGTKYDAFNIKIVNQICHRDMKNWTVTHPRLFRAGHGSISEKEEVHESIQINGKVGGALKHPVYHHTYQTVSESIQKLDRYTVEETISATKPPNMIGLYVKPAVFFVYFLLWKRLLLDGKDGIFIAFRKAFYKYTAAYRKWLKFNDKMPEATEFHTNIPTDEIEDRVDDS